MTAPGRYSAEDGSFAKSAGGAAARGAVLVGVAVVLGLIILAVAYDGGDDDAAVADDSSDTVPADDSSGTVPADDTSGTVPVDDTSDDTADDTADDDDATTTTPTVDSPTTRPPGEVKVAVVNGVGEPGLAAVGQTTLATAGYVAEAADAATVPTADTAILYIEGYSADAAAVAETLGAPASVIQAAPPDPAALTDSDSVGDFHVFVIQGEDRLAG